jgi:hypothetical protein
MRRANVARKLGIVWGAKAIGDAIGRTERQTHYLLEQGAIKAARKVGMQWCASESGLREQFCAKSSAVEQEDAA